MRGWALLSVPWDRLCAVRRALEASCRALPLEAAAQTPNVYVALLQLRGELGSGADASDKQLIIIKLSRKRGPARRRDEAAQNSEGEGFHKDS